MKRPAASCIWELATASMTRLLVLAGLGLAMATPSFAGQQPIDWSTAADAFAAGQERADMVYTRTTAAQCVGRWMLHGDAVDDGAFPMAAMEAFPPELRLPFAIESVEFFTMEVKDERARRKAGNEAERLLRKALKGNGDAFRRYFMELGSCSSKAEEVRDYAGDEAEASADAPVGDPATPAFDRLKALVGTWQPARKPEHPLRIRFYLTAADSVLVEEWSGNGRPDSLTLYHRDGEDLLATHYCPQGNQPRMKLIPDSTGSIRFTLRDVTDLDPATEEHQHDLWFTLDDADHMTRSEIYRNGDGGELPSVRQLERVRG